MPLGPDDPALVVWSEQGLGDAIQFGRYLPLLAAAGIPFELRCRKPLFTLFRDWFGLGERAVLETLLHRSQRSSSPCLSAEPSLSVWQ